jgi:hypothetical protein
MNCSPLPLPTCFSPAGSKGGPPLKAPDCTRLAARGGPSGVAPETGGVAKPQPCLPCWNEVAGLEQMPVGKAQQSLAQSALERHCPVLNCLPLPLPTLGAPLGSKGGTTTAVDARAMRAAMAMEMVFILVICRRKGCVESAGRCDVERRGVPGPERMCKRGGEVDREVLIHVPFMRAVHTEGHHDMVRVSVTPAAKINVEYNVECEVLLSPNELV